MTDMFPTNRPRGSVTSSNGNGSFSRSSSITEILHATPPRHNDNVLPSSPSSARLRRVAPSPLKLASRSNLNFSSRSPESESPDYSKPRDGVKGRQLEYDHATKGEVADDEQPQRGRTSDMLISERGGPIATHAQPQIRGQLRGQATTKVINQAGRGGGAREHGNGAGFGDAVEGPLGHDGSEDEERMTRGEWVRATHAREIKVNFRTDVFNIEPPRAISSVPTSPTSEDQHGPAPHPVSPESVYSQWSRASLRGSFATFGVGRENSTFSMTPPAHLGYLQSFVDDEEDEDDPTASSYGGRDSEALKSGPPEEETETGDPEEPINWDDPEGVPVPIYLSGWELLGDDQDEVEPSPATTVSELVTPDHYLSNLPNPDSDADDTPTKPRSRYNGPTKGLMLELRNEQDPLVREYEDETEHDQEHDRNRRADAGVTPAAAGRKGGTHDAAYAGRVPKYFPPPVPTLRVSSPLTQSSHIPTLNHPITTSIPASTSSINDSTSNEPTLLQDFDRKTYLEMLIDMDQRGTAGYKVTLPFKRISKAEVWQEKEETALATAAKWHDPPPEPQPFQQTGCVVFGQPPRERDQWTFTYSKTHLADDGSGRRTKTTLPSLRRVMVSTDDGPDYMTNKVHLQIAEYGVYIVCGYDRYGRVQWQFEYLVTHQTDQDGNILPEQRVSLGYHRIGIQI